jgi:hypothetical protein
MTPAEVQGLIERRGETLTLRRELPVQTDVTVKGRVVGYAPQQLVGEIQQGDRVVIVGNAEIAAAAWPGPPKSGDRLVFANGSVFTLRTVDTRKIGDEIAGHWLIVRGT